MFPFLAFAWLACTVWFIVSIVKFRRKTGKLQTILYSFLSGLFAFLLFLFTSPTQLAASKAGTSGGGPTTNLKSIKADVSISTFNGAKKYKKPCA